MRKLLSLFYLALLVTIGVACSRVRSGTTEAPKFTQIFSQEPTPVPSATPLAAPTFSPTPQIPQTKVVNYTASDALFPNPERGFFHRDATHDTSLGETAIEDYAPLDPLTLQSYRRLQPQMGRENVVGELVIYPPMSLVARYIILNDFVEIDISQEFLEKLQADFDAVRSAGMKIFLRFSYVNHISQKDPRGVAIPPFHDPGKAVILRHLEDLRPILQANSDVIAFVEAGFIGVWGEWALTDSFGEPWALSDQDLEERAEVLQAILEAVPTDRKVLVRYVQYKQSIFASEHSEGTGTARTLSSEQAHTESYISRVGFHNDCFLSNEHDSGTYGTFDGDQDRINQDREYLAAETRYVPMGGETCQLGPPLPTGHPSKWNPDIRFLCPNALKETAQFHWSYLNIDWYRGVLDTWNTGISPHDCFDEIARRLGYRFSLIRGHYTDIVRPGSQINIEIELRNEGFAAPFNPRLVELVFRETNSGHLFGVTLPHDPRFWIPDNADSYTMIHSICTPTDMPVGKYELLLNLPDPEPSLYGRPPYSIRLANEDVWEPDTGFNKLLHTTLVTARAVGKPCAEDSLVISGLEPVPYSELPSVGPGFIVATNGGFTNEESEVISGLYSIVGSHSGTGTYSSYLTTNIAFIRFLPQNTYQVSFDYRILKTPNEGFETLFYSPAGGSEGNWLPSIVITGEEGDSGTVTLTSTLLEYTDYTVVWNIMGTGAIVIDNIQITNQTTGEQVATEDAE